VNVLSIQSHVAYGHVGNAAAAFALQRLGHEVWAVPTALYSNHPAHGGHDGRLSPPELIDEMVGGLAAQGFLARCDALLSGYLGSVENGAAVLRALDLLRCANPRAVYLCDPVFGHAGRGAFAADGVAELFRDQIAPLADIVTPNHFELRELTNAPVQTMAEAVAAARSLLAGQRAQGPQSVLCTSLRRADGADDRVETLLVRPTGAWVVSTPLLAGEMFGAGDLFAALYLAHRARDGDTPEALSGSVSATYAVLKSTVEAGGGELALIAAQHDMAAPATIFPAQKAE
jgi:pyridoxine kinase